MPVHYHLVLRVDTADAKFWSDEEVAKRWTTLYKVSSFVNRWLLSCIVYVELNPVWVSVVESFR